MNVTTELFKRKAADFIVSEADRLDIDEFSVSVKSEAISVLEAIQDVLRNDSLSDFDAIEEIVCIFERYGLDAGSRHDF